jgi:hypothetical protein
MEGWMRNPGFLRESKLKMQVINDIFKIWKEIRELELFQFSGYVNSLFIPGPSSFLKWKAVNLLPGIFCSGISDEIGFLYGFGGAVSLGSRGEKPDQGRAVFPIVRGFQPADLFRVAPGRYQLYTRE